MSDENKKSYEEQNAEGHAETILAYYKAQVQLADGAEKVDVEGEEFESIDDIVERIQESALSVEVRGDWHSPGDKDGNEPTEFLILLSTGGPALRIIGDLGQYNTPENPHLEHQNWGTPWTRYEPDCADDDWDAALLWFCGVFYFGG